eukprot:TRINITY_DN6087_c0_g1_i1.p1 TRINITY_DN6087_c0_g1~~TRINITY_DN6087_c0_g1_i1.p1  ORF type:complete len:208 (-),score=30.15 TRINITY_DN6087_c0_g1_i1:123-746(-)
MLLLAHPFLKDSTFCQAVILILKNDEAGTIGVMLENRIPTKGVYRHGGPILDKNFILWSPKDLITKSGIKLTEGLYWSQIMTLSDKIPPGLCLFRGYTRWNPGQLESELRSGTWFLVQAPMDFVFPRVYPSPVSNPQEVTSRNQITEQQESDLSEEGQEHASLPLPAPPPPVQYSFDYVDPNNPLWKKTLRELGGEYELCVYFFYKE